MNIRLTLFLAALTINSINAESIRERFKKEKDLADERVSTVISSVENKAKTFQKIADFFNIKRNIKPILILSLMTNQEKYIIEHSIIQASLLEEMLICMNHNQCIDETQSASECYKKISYSLENAMEMPQKEKELRQEELAIIEAKDLRQSWFWWLY